MVLIYFKMPLISPKYSDPAICTWLRKVGDEKIKACRAMLRSYHRITQKCTQLQGIIPGPLSRKSQRECFLACMIMCDFVILWNILLCNSVEERHLIKLSIHLPQREFYLKNAISSPALNVDRFFFSSKCSTVWLASQDQIPLGGVKTGQAQVQRVHHLFVKFSILIR